MTNKINETVDSLLKQYDTNFSTILGRIDNDSWVTYIVIFVVCLFFAKLVNINLSIIFFIFLAILVSYIIYSKRRIEKITIQEQHRIKLDLIRPRPKRIDSYPNLIDFLYSIREFYYINPSAFFEIVNNIDNFIQLYEEIMFNKVLYCTQNLEVALGFARNALNSLHSMIYNLDVDKHITRKFHKSLKAFHYILQQYSTRMIRRCNREFNYKNLNNTSQYYYEYGPKPF